MGNGLLLRKCTESDLQDILALQDAVFATLGEHSDLLRRNTAEMFAECTREPNLTLGLFDGDLLAGIGIFVDPGDGAESLATHLEYFSVEKAGNFKLAMIREEYRGQGFQQRIGRIFSRMAARRGYTHILATVSPQNPHSRDNLLRSGFVYDHSEEKYGGLIRDVMVKDLTATAPAGSEEANKKALPPLYEGEAELLEN
ncbi:MAG: GNAT family N-acetyltransferase [Lachnospiraceae bacterium]|nr:GNAT family N-acetyltransferase [Lachnospiraceae bacterium]